jgi:hypothetical protein
MKRPPKRHNRGSLSFVSAFSLFSVPCPNDLSSVPKRPTGIPDDDMSFLSLPPRNKTSCIHDAWVSRWPCTTISDLLGIYGNSCLNYLLPWSRHRSLYFISLLPFAVTFWKFSSHLSSVHCRKFPVPEAGSANSLLARHFPLTVATTSTVPLSWSSHQLLVGLSSN